MGSYSSRLYRINRKLILMGHPNCALCGMPGADSADHILPKSRGGDDSLANLQPAHNSCNGSRGNRMKIKYRARY